MTMIYLNNVSFGRWISMSCSGLTTDLWNVVHAIRHLNGYIMLCSITSSYQTLSVITIKLYK